MIFHFEYGSVLHSCCRVLPSTFNKNVIFRNVYIQNPNYLSKSWNKKIDRQQIQYFRKDINKTKQTFRKKTFELTEATSKLLLRYWRTLLLSPLRLKCRKWIHYRNIYKALQASSWVVNNIKEIWRLVLFQVFLNLLSFKSSCYMCCV